MQQQLSQKTLIKTPMPVIAGVLAIISGCFALLFALPFFSGLFRNLSGTVHPINHFPWYSVTVLIICLLAIIGGIFALIRKNWIVSLIGAIASIFPLVILGILAIVLIILSKKEFSQPV